MQTDNLSDKELDYFVAISIGKTDAYLSHFLKSCVVSVQDKSDRTIHIPFNPSKKWLFGGPIIEKNRIQTTEDFIVNGQKRFSSVICKGNKLVFSVGDTILESAMRCFVKFKLGNTVELNNKFITKEH